MAIESVCPQCQTRFVVPDHYAGRTAVCPRCGAATAVPGDVRQHVLLTPQAERPAQGPASPTGAPVQPAPGYAAHAYPAQMQPAQAIDLLAAMSGASPGLSMLEGLSGDPSQAAWAAGASPTIAESAQTHPGTDKNLSGARGNVRLSARAAMAVFSAGSVALFAMIVLTLPKIGFVLSIALALAGGAVIFAGLVWNNYVAMRESMGTAMWSMLCPPYTLYFLLSRWDKTRKAFWVISIGLGLTVGGLVSMWHTNNLIAERTGKKPGAGARAAKTEPSRATTGLLGSVPASAPATPKPAAASEPAAAPPAASTATPAPATPPPTAKPTKKQGRDPEDIVPATDLVTPPTFDKPPAPAPGGSPASK